jgi:hypothetical protein
MISHKDIQNCIVVSDNLRLSLRLISIGQLNTLLHLHPQPINLVVYKEPYCLRMRVFILKLVSRLDAFSGYPFQT